MLASPISFTNLLIILLLNCIIQYNVIHKAIHNSLYNVIYERVACTENPHVHHVNDFVQLSTLNEQHFQTTSLCALHNFVSNQLKCIHTYTYTVTRSRLMYILLIIASSSHTHILPVNNIVAIQLIK